MAANYQVIHRGELLEKASKALILLHGRGGSARDIINLAREFCDDSFHIAAPEAPNHSWYPQSFLAEEKYNEPWLSQSVQAVKNLIDEIAASIPLHQIFLMGFSQGACLALETSARHAAKYGGVVAFTGGLIGSQLNVAKYKGEFGGTVVFIGNGDKDPHVSLARSQESKEIMEKMGAQVTLKVYPGRPHLVSQEEIDWVKTHMFA